MLKLNVCEDTLNEDVEYHLDQQMLGQHNPGPRLQLLWQYSLAHQDPKVVELWMFSQSRSGIPLCKYHP